MSSYYLSTLYGSIVSSLLIIFYCVILVAQNLDDFRRRLGLSGRDIKNFNAGLHAVATGNYEALEAMGMPPNAGSEVAFIFDLLLKSGFGNERL